MKLTQIILILTISYGALMAQVSPVPSGTRTDDVEVKEVSLNVKDQQVVPSVQRKASAHRERSSNFEELTIKIAPTKPNVKPMPTDANGNVMQSRSQQGTRDAVEIKTNAQQVLPTREVEK